MNRRFSIKSHRKLYVKIYVIFEYLNIRFLSQLINIFQIKY